MCFKNEYTTYIYLVMQYNKAYRIFKWITFYTILEKMDVKFSVTSFFLFSLREMFSQKWEVIA